MTSSQCSKHQCPRALVKMFVTPAIISSVVSRRYCGIYYIMIHSKYPSKTHFWTLTGGVNFFFLGLPAQPTYLPGVLGQRSGTPLVWCAEERPGASSKRPRSCQALAPMSNKLVCSEMFLNKMILNIYVLHTVC